MVINNNNIVHVGRVSSYRHLYIALHIVIKHTRLWWETACEYLPVYIYIYIHILLYYTIRQMDVRVRIARLISVQYDGDECECEFFFSLFVCIVFRNVRASAFYFFILFFLARGPKEATEFRALWIIIIIIIRCYCVGRIYADSRALRIRVDSRKLPSRLLKKKKKIWVLVVNLTYTLYAYR